MALPDTVAIDLVGDVGQHEAGVADENPVCDKVFAIRLDNVPAGFGRIVVKAVARKRMRAPQDSITVLW